MQIKLKKCLEVKIIIPNFVVNLKIDDMTVNDFILKLQQISDDKKELPLIIQCLNGLEVEPKIKMKFENYGSPLLDDKIEAIIVTWRD